MCSHQQKLQQIKQQLKDAESGSQDAAQVEILK